MKYVNLLIVLLLAQVSLVAQNYDESLVPPYILPKLLKTEKGKKVHDAKQWEKKRRPEIIHLFEENVYGVMPLQVDSLRSTLVREDDQAMGGKARLKEVDIAIFRQQQSVVIHLVLFIPKQRSGAAPVFLLINNRGRNNTDPTRQHQSEFWPAEMVIDSGYAVAAFHVSDLAPDNKDSYAQGMLRLYPEMLTADNGMKAIGAWAWGASRVLDYFETDKDIDAKRVAVVGHSRGGKTALWAAAQDKRFALCFASCSGNTGAALSHREYGERIEKINATFPHWFANNYRKYNNKETELPVDQHMLIACIATRPVYTTNATKDLWADPPGSFLAMKEAEPVYKLYGAVSALPATIPVPDQPIIHSILGYHLREGIHDLTAYDWRSFISFAHYHYKAP